MYNLVKKQKVFLVLLQTLFFAPMVFGLQSQSDAVTIRISPQNVYEIVHEIKNALFSLPGNSGSGDLANYEDALRRAYSIPASHEKIQEEVMIESSLTGLSQGSKNAFRSGSVVDKNIIEVQNYFMGKIFRMWPVVIGFPLAGYLSYKVAQLSMELIRAALLKPQVVIDTNTHFMNRMKRKIFGPEEFELPKMIVDPEIEELLEMLVKATILINKAIQDGDEQVTYRNIVLYGPPGTGKTMFARQLAKRSGMYFAEVTGSSFFQAGAGVAAINELFRWAKSSQGLILFIDEGDSLFPKRDGLGSDDLERIQIINHFLNHLGTESNRFMVIIATNRELEMDEAISRRFPDKVRMDLPNEQLRYRLLEHYKDKLLLSDSKKNSFKESVNKVLNDTKLKEIAVETEGLSNGHLYYIIDGMQHRVITRSDGLLTENIVDALVREQVEYNKRYQSKKAEKDRRLQINEAISQQMIAV